MVDLNNNGVSDVWEKTYNNDQLLTDYSPTADPDGDGWTNAQEAIAGTDPFHATSQDGFPVADVTHIPAVYGTDENGAPVAQSPNGFVVHWNAQIGKRYSLLGSSDLSSGSWFPIDSPVTALNSEIQMGMSPAHTDGTLPPALFWKTTISDVDSDGDTFTDYEEYRLHTDPDVADRDADGLPDLWEIFYGLDPNDNGSGNPDNGPEGDRDHDGYSNFAEQSGGSDPQNAGNVPLAGGDTSSQSAGGPPTLLSSSITAYDQKFGFYGLQSNRYYLNYSFSHTNTQSNGDANTYTFTESYDFETSLSTVDISGEGPLTYYDGDWTDSSDTSSSYEGTDETTGAKSKATITLSNEYTTELLTQRVEDSLPSFPSFTENSPYASIWLNSLPFETAYQYVLAKAKFKWEVHKPSAFGEVVNWLEIFHPEDSPDLVVEPKTWINTTGATTSPTYSIDPTLRNGKKNGRYEVVPVEFELREVHDLINGWDSTKAEDWVAVGVGKTNSVASLWLDGDIPEGTLELVADPSSAAYLSVQSEHITGRIIDLTIRGLKATSAAGGKVLLRMKSSKATVATLRVRVFDEVEVKVQFYNVVDQRQENTKFNRADFNEKALAKLNLVYGPQANIKFTAAGPPIEIDMSQDLQPPLSTEPMPFIFNENGTFPYQTQRDAVLKNAFPSGNPPSNILPIFVVSLFSGEGELGWTVTSLDCFIDNRDAEGLVAAHEVGHYFDLSREQKGQGEGHDMGPWPDELIQANPDLKGLMYDHVEGTTRWLRHRDWYAANQQALMKFSKP
jgi:hypothetical protein